MDALVCSLSWVSFRFLRNQAWRHGSMAWGSLFSAAGRRTTTLRLRRRSTPAPPSSLLAASAAGRGATRAGPRWARSGSGLTTVTVPGRLSGRAGCHSRPGRDRLRAGSGSLCSPLSFAGRRAGVRPTPGSRLSPGTLAGALDPLRRFAPSGTGASRRELTGVASGPGPSCVDRQGRHLSQGPRLWTGPCSWLIWAGAGVPDRQRVPCSASSWSAVRPPHLSLATQPGPGQLSQQVSPPPGAGLSSWAGHRAGPSLPPGSPPFRRWGTDGPSAQHPVQDSDLSCGPRAGPPGRPGAGTRRTGRALHSCLRPETQIRSRTRCLTRNPTSAPGPRVPPAFPAFRCKRRRRCNEASISPCCAVLNQHPFLSALLAASLTNTPAPPSFSLCTDLPPQGQVFVLL